MKPLRTREPQRAAKDSSSATGENRIPAWTALAYFAAAFGAAWYTAPALAGLHPPSLVFFTFFQLVLMSLSVPAAAFGARGRGYVSLDRLALVAAVLVFGAAPAAWVAGASAMLWTLIADPRREPWLPRVTRAAANAGMFLLATLAAGLVYAGLGGVLPGRPIDLVDFGRICLLILTLQAINELLFLPMTWRSMTPAARRQPVDWRSTLNELLIGLSGIIAALAFIRLSWLGFAVYVAFVIAVAVLFKYVAGVAERERERARELGAVNRVNQAVNSAAGIDDIVEVIFRETQGLMDFAAFIIGIYDRDADELDVRLNYDDGVRHPPARRKPGEGLLAWTMQHNEAVFVPDRRTTAHPSVRGAIILGRSPVSIISIPINFGNETVGVLSVQDYKPYAFKPRALHLLESFASQIAVAIVNTRLFAELKNHQQELEDRVASRTAELELLTASLEETMRQKEALLARLEQENRRDPLTRLANRRHLDEALEQELHRALRFGHPLALAMCDLDHFKRVNDDYGHALGDEVLYRVAEILHRGVRATDLVARYGGEEFVLLLPETDREQARVVCEKLREQVADAGWNDLEADIRVTMSFGVATVDEATQSSTALLESADRALYAAKRGGRNRVVIARGNTGMRSNA